MSDTKEFIEDAEQGQPIDVETALSDDQLEEGGLKPVKAWVRTKQAGNAARTKRYKERKQELGVKQLNLQAPQETHEALREIAARTRAGEPLERVLRDLAGAEKMGMFVQLIRWIRG
jgi:hypothetical protein